MAGHFPLALLVTLSTFSLSVFCGKLTATTAKVSFYSDINKLESANFEYFVKGNNVQYGTRFGVDLYKVANFAALFGFLWLSK